MRAPDRLFEAGYQGSRQDAPRLPPCACGVHVPCQIIPASVTPTAAVKAFCFEDLQASSPGVQPRLNFGLRSGLFPKKLDFHALVQSAYTHGLHPPLNLASIASGIELDAEGIWVSRNISAVSYPESDNQHCFAIEDDSFWFAHRNRCILHAVRAYPPEGTFFDVGGGNGYVAKAIQDSGVDVVLVEPGNGAQNARRRGLSTVVRSTLMDAGFQRGVCPAIGLFDVVEHIEDDRAFLSEIHSYLAPGGRVYITVPTFQQLWSQDDVEAGHYRRYRLPQIGGVLTALGFQIEFESYFFGFLLAPVYLLRAMPYSLGLRSKKDSGEKIRSDHQVSNPVVKKAIAWLSLRELNALASGRNIGAGTSCLVVARKNPWQRSPRSLRTSGDTRVAVGAPGSRRARKPAPPPGSGPA